MRVMTFNLRFANPLNGPNRWECRKELVVETILASRPHLLGTQEGTVPQLDYLSDHLPDYRPLIEHREVDPTCQYPTIFYRAKDFQVKESGEFWLSETPSVHRSKSWDSAFPRMVTYGLFQEPGKNLWFYFINTHLDNISSLARLQGSRMIRRHFQGRKEPSILVGDFNEPPEAEVYQELLGSGSPWADTWRALHPPGEEPPTQHAFNGKPRGSRIDWILVTPPFQVSRVEIVTHNREGAYPSDHFPYLAEVAY
ncbi:MAG: endonuclease/exonuclease/phosphatase family protein [Thermodesulfobacteriota bacterium]